MARSYDLTSGSIPQHLLRLAAPLIMGNILQQLYNTVDAFILGRFAGELEFAAVGVAGSVMNLFLFMITGACTGISVIFAQLSAQLRGLDVGTVTVGTAYSAFYSPLARIISDFHARYGGIQVQLRGGYSTELITQLNAHQLDLCFISVREGGHDWLPIGYDELTAWVPVAHPMAWLPALPVAAFAKEPYIETYPDKDIDNARVFARCGIMPNLKFSTMDSLATYSMVEAGLGLAMNNALNGRAWSGDVRILPLDPPQIVEIGAATLPDLSPAAQTFLDFLEPHLVEFLSEKS